MLRPRTRKLESSSMSMRDNVLISRPMCAFPPFDLSRDPSVDALLGVDDPDPVAVDRADVDAGVVFDVDAGLGDHVRHRRAPRSLGPRVGLAPFPSVFLTLCRPATRRSISSGIV